MHVERCHDRDALRALMNVDAFETAYALGDLGATFWELSEFWGAFHSSQLKGIVLIYSGFDPPSLTMHGDGHAVEHILQALDLPGAVYGMFPAKYRAAVAAYYSTDQWHDLLRMRVMPDDFCASETVLAGDAHLRRLTSADIEPLNALYAAAPDGEAVVAFQGRQVDLGIFYGVQSGDNLIAAAGTHVMSHAENIGAIGNVFTHPDARRQGLGSLTTAAVTQTLFDEGITRVVLNVKKKNHAAQRIYEKLGYQPYADFIEGPAFKI